MPKECVVCKHPAVVVARITRGEQTATTYLCENCARRVGNKMSIEIVSSAIQTMPKGTILCPPQDQPSIVVSPHTIPSREKNNVDHFSDAVEKPKITTCNKCGAATTKGAQFCPQCENNMSASPTVPQKNTGWKIAFVCLLFTVTIIPILYFASRHLLNRPNNIEEHSNIESVDEISSDIVVPDDNITSLKTILTNKHWIEALWGKSMLSFMEDGSARYNDMDSTWEIEENKITITPNNSQPLVLSLDETENGILIKPLEGYEVFVQESDLPIIQPVIRKMVADMAIQVDLANLFYTIEQNEAKASLEYKDKIVMVNVYAQEINDDHFSYMTTEMGITKNINVYLPTSDLAKLSKNEQVCIVGQVWSVQSWGFILFNAFIVDAD